MVLYIDERGDDMIRGTTPKHIFNIPFDTKMIEKVRIIYAQHDYPILIKEKDDCTLQDKTITVELTQEETLKFDADYDVQVQMRILTTGGDALASDIKTVSCDEILESVVLQ